MTLWRDNPDRYTIQCVDGIELNLGVEKGLNSRSDVVGMVVFTMAMTTMAMIMVIVS